MSRDFTCPEFAKARVFYLPPSLTFSSFLVSLLNRYLQPHLLFSYLCLAGGSLFKDRFSAAGTDFKFRLETQQAPAFVWCGFTPTSVHRTLGPEL